MAIIRLFQTHIKLLTRDFRSTPNHQRKHPHKTSLPTLAGSFISIFVGFTAGPLEPSLHPGLDGHLDLFFLPFQAFGASSSHRFGARRTLLLSFSEENTTRNKGNTTRRFGIPETRTPRHPLSPRRSNDRHQGVVVRAVERPTSVTDRPVGPHLSGG